MATFATHARQGDVNILNAKKFGTPMPNSGLTQVKPEGKRLVLARGSAIGNAHAVDADDATLWERADGARWLKVERKTTLLHPEHHQPQNDKTIEIPPGEYVVARQVESTDEQLRRVED
jgi:hypothetical protein